MTLTLCDQHGMFLDGLAEALAGRGYEISAAVTDVHALEPAHRSAAPDVCVLGLGNHEGEWLAAACDIKRDHPATAVVLLGSGASPAVWAAYDSGAVDALVDKRCDIATLDKVLARVESGERVVEGCVRPSAEPAYRTALDYLTDREREVLRLIVAGFSTQRMSAVLGVSANTVRTHVQHVLAKLGVDRRSKAIKVAVELGLTGQAESR